MRRSALACLVLSSLFVACSSSQKDWDRANATGTLDAYQAFLQRHPKDSHAEEARERVRALQAAEEAHAQEASDKLAALQEPQPAPQAATQAPKVAPSDGNADVQPASSSYRIQLGAFKSKKQAQHARAQLKARYGKILRDVVLVAPKPPEKLTRVRSGPMSQADAKAACARLRKAHQHCEVVRE